MELSNMPGISIRLTSLTQKVPASQEDGQPAEYREYRQGDPIFDAYAAEQKKRMEPHLPRNFMLGTPGEGAGMAHHFSQKITETFDLYYDGLADKRTLESVMSEAVGSLKGFYSGMGFDAEEFMPKLLLDVYDKARISNMSAASSRSWKDSRRLAAQYNGSDRNSRDVIYYDAKYYYQSEEMKGTIQTIIRKIGQQHGVSDLDLPTDYSDGDLRKSIYSSYNTIINHDARSSTLVGNMLDENMVPPKGFRFFYKGNESGRNCYPLSLPSDGTPESVFDGILHVWYGDWSFTGRVPVRQDAIRFPVSINMYELISKRCATIPEAIVPALRNFDFFAVVQSGNYFQNHPRNL